MAAKTADIDVYDVRANQLNVRGRPLLESVAGLEYAELVIRAITGRAVPRRLLGPVVEAARGAAATLTPGLPPHGEPRAPSEALIARACALLLTSSWSLAPRSPWPELFGDDEWHAFVLYHALAAAVGFKPYAPRGRFDRRAYARELLDVFAAERSGPAPFSPDKLMGALVGGFGIVAPTTALARFSASTRAPLEWGVVASAMGCGPAHLGACSLAMRRLEEAGLADAPVEDVVAAYCRTKPYPGFGHPIMPRDPRVDYLLDAYRHVPLARKARVVADAITAASGVRPNIDFAAGALLSAYGVPASAGSLVFWYCRQPIVLAHVCAKRAAHAFGMRSAEARAKYRKLPKSWI